ncbi:MAG: hypothetical protein ACREBR_05020 [bacterium]
MKNLRHIGTSAFGVALFFFSFHVGEASFLGGWLHLMGCAFFCTGVHGIHDSNMDKKFHKHEHH